MFRCRIMKIIESATVNSALMVPLAMELAQTIPSELMQEIELHCKQTGR